MLAVFGSVALDTIRTPKKTLKSMLGGAATFAAVSASNFVDTGLVGVVGNDFPERYRKLLKRRMDLRGLVVGDGKTFRYDGSYDRTLSVRKTLKTELNVLDGFEPKVPEEYKRSRFVYLANNDPVQNLAVLREFDKVKFSMCDTIDFWIHSKRDAVIKMISRVDAVVINDEEARLLTKEFNLIQCARRIMRWGARYVIIKKGEHGSLMFSDDMVFASAGFPLENVVDPTGAGDSFAGAMIGYLADKNSVKAADIRRAVVYGNVLGSFAVQGYGIGNLPNLKRAEISRRVRQYEKMVGF